MCVEENKVEVGGVGGGGQERSALTGEAAAQCECNESGGLGAASRGR